MMDAGTAARRDMVEHQLRARGISDSRVLVTMREVPRDAFLPAEHASEAYAARALPIGEGETMSQPLVTALMLEAAEIKPSDRVLEIGAGSGYTAALLSQLAECVFAVERHFSLASKAEKRLRDLGLRNVHIRCDDGTGGWPEAAPFDVIIVSACAERVPLPLTDQLSIGGRLIMPLGPADGDQQLVKTTREGQFDYRQQELLHVRFVPLVGRHLCAAQPMPG
ncbi:protein-L-isoaspartate(D-aspartate) O-methyltransferase [Acetobacteraceae bacterium H6797]|nr:protein-L-isoaspartate(D-aspartate) O-methyltransferase [Acetobacteraceae bacterium H6797]